MRWLTLFAVLIAAPAGAGDLVNSDQVFSCLEERGAFEKCAGTLNAPCAHMEAGHMSRACTYRLRLRWEEMLAREERSMVERLTPVAAQRLAKKTENWRRAVERNCGRIGHDRDLRDPRTASLRRNRCRIVRIAHFWHELVLAKPETFAPDGQGD